MTKLLVIQLSVVEGANDADAVYEAQKLADPHQSTWMYPLPASEKGYVFISALEVDIVHKLEDYGAIEIKPIRESLPRQNEAQMTLPLVPEAA